MARWTDIATWRGPVPDSNQDGPMVEVRGYVIHIAQGYYEGTINYQKQPGREVSSHFVISDGAAGQGQDGDIAQLVDTSVTAYTQIAGNGHWLSGENAGFVPHPLTSAQIEANARIFAKGHLVYGYPLAIANTPNDRGLGHHSMGCDYNWGHCDCPGPNIIAQKSEILARAQQIVGGDVAILDKTDVSLIYNSDLDAGPAAISMANAILQAREAAQQAVSLLQSGLVIDYDLLASKIVEQLPVGTLTKADVVAAVDQVMNTVRMTTQAP